MAIQITDIKTFFKRLSYETDPSDITAFTWLIGAGMSVSSGIPLAIDVSKRIIVFEYLLDSQIDFPWKSSSYDKLKYSNECLQDFFSWFEDAENTVVDNYLEPSIDWLRTKPHFSNVSITKPECYQLLFQHLFQSPKTSIRFLTNLIKRAKGVNLAHLSLAGILRDFPQWGKTVFTTNFDDLLLKAILQLNHSARIFGEYDTEVIPGTKPNYPQIVYLHGKHTGYTLLNSKEQVSLVNPNLQTAFKTHISDSNLIVIGYSGWDDLVMRTLLELKDNKELIRGNIYWIPYLSEKTMLPEIFDFFNSLRSTKVHILVNEKQNLNADTFMLEFCSVLNSVNGGFSPYRREIIKNAEFQHTFVISELKKYPSHNPEKSLDEIAEALVCLDKKDVINAEKKFKGAVVVFLADDLPPLFRLNGLTLSGEYLIKQYRIKEAMEILDLAVNIGKSIDESEPNLQEILINAMVLFTKGHYLSGRIDKAYDISSQVNYRIGKIDNPSDEILLKYHSLAAYIKLSKGHLSVNENGEEFKNLAERNPDHSISKTLPLFLGWWSYVNGHMWKAIEFAKQSFEYFSSIDNKIGIANSHLLFATIYIDDEQFKNALSEIEKCNHTYELSSNKLGLGVSLSLESDFYLKTKELQKALEVKQKSIDVFDSINMIYNLEIAEFDKLLIEYRENAKEFDKGKFDRYIDTDDNTINPFIRQKLESLLKYNQLNSNEEE